ncbi:DNA polymerase III subunit beta [Fretibacter rubidus]|uniref:DNA polymerase III subunit beta n=1 Tax=Fretibacter rubidus TaxID=570162 RepID=UPI00352A716E
MKISIERAALLTALGHVQNVVERRNTIPILSNVLMTAKDGALTLVATDLDIEISEATSADVDAPGDITAPAHTLYDIARKLPDGAQVSLKIGADDRLEVDAGRSHFTLPLLPAGDFPKMTADGFTHNFVLKAGELRRLIDKTKFAISTEETRYYLNGIYMHAHDGLLRAVATDGHRLALSEMELPAGAADLPGVIIPRKTIAEIRRLIDSGDGEVSLSVSEAKIRFHYGTAVLTSKLIDGSFPDYERVIPKGNTKELVIDNAIFAKAVDRVATISAEKSRSVKLSLSQDSLALAVNNPEHGNAHEDLMVDYSAEPLEIGFNAKYLLDVAGQIEGRDATFYLDSPAAPALVKDSEDPSSLFVLMPLRV